MLISKPFFATSLALAVEAATIRDTDNHSSGGCEKVTFSGTASADNLLFSSPPDITNATSIADFIDGYVKTLSVPTQGTIRVSGSFSVDAIYCKPTGKPRNAVQLLVPGITYNKTMWSGFGLDPKYDWQKFATANGYHTVAIDRLGSGTNLKRPNPLNFVQGAMGVEVVHQVVQALRTGTNSPLGKTFSRIIGVGHSYGSEIIAIQLGKYNNDLDAAVLTGYSAGVNGTRLPKFVFRSASTVTPRFSDRALGYVTLADLTQRTAPFYGGAYDAKVAEFDNAHEDVISTGEAVTSAFGFVPAVGYTKPVLAVTGDKDAIFCDVAPPFTSCTDIMETTANLFPNATYEYYIPPSTGHTLTLHYSAPETFAATHRFLDKYF